MNTSPNDDDGLSQGQMRLFEPVVVQLLLTRKIAANGVLRPDQININFSNGTVLERTTPSKIPTGTYKVSLSNFRTSHPFFLQFNGKTTDLIQLGGGSPSISYKCGREEKLCKSFTTQTYTYMYDYSSYNNRKSKATRTYVDDISCPTLKCEVQCTNNSPCIITFEQTIPRIDFD